MNCPQNAKKRSLFARKNGRKAPQREKYLISGFGHLRCSALENSGSKSPQTRMKPEKNGTTSILSSLHGAGEGKAAAPQRADSPRGGAPLPASSLKTYHRYVFLTLRPSQGSIPRHSEKKESSHKGCFPFLERERGIEPPYSAWEADVLPLNYSRKDAIYRMLCHFTIFLWGLQEKNAGEKQNCFSTQFCKSQAFTLHNAIKF